MVRTPIPDTPQPSLNAPLDPVSAPPMAGERSSPAVPPLLQALRTGTAGHHAAIEAVMPFDTPPTVERHGRQLTGLLLGLQPWTAALAAALPMADRHWLASAPRVDRLRADLAALGWPDAPERQAVWRDAARAAADHAARLPLDSDAAALGALYVLEGSALGGRVIVGRVRGERPWPDGRQAPQPALAGALSYFAGDGDAGERWRRFGQRLATPALQTPAAGAAAVAAARATFELLTASVARALAQPLAEAELVR